MIVLYGIVNCDTVKKARAWLDDHDLAYRFHDYRKAGVDPDALRGWVGRLEYARPGARDDRDRRNGRTPVPSRAAPRAPREPAGR